MRLQNTQEKVAKLPIAEGRTTSAKRFLLVSIRVHSRLKAAPLSMVGPKDGTPPFEFLPGEFAAAMAKTTRQAPAQAELRPTCAGASPQFILTRMPSF
jgi:hypothetical protein